jgi:glycosyltransferase involved in cell wall biosynthesis
MAHQLAIFGPVPPPIGGVAVHVERLLPHLDQAGIDYVVYNTGGPTETPGRVVSIDQKRWRFVRHLLTSAEPVVVMFGNRWQAWVASWIWSRVRGKKVVIAFHGETLRWVWESRGFLVRKLIANGLRSATRLIAASPHIRDAICSYGDFGDKITILPAFIPPVWCDEEAAAIAEEITRFCGEHDPLILATGAPVLRENNTDLYGIDMTIELVDRIRDSYPKVGVLWSLLDFIGSIPEYAEAMRQEVSRRGLGAHWLFTPPQPFFYPLYRLADLFVRPTLSDGDAVSLREALHFGVPALASDAAPRPEGTILFRKRDQEDFERAVRETLAKLGAEREQLRDRRSASAVEREVALLQEVIEEATR